MYPIKGKLGTPELIELLRNAADELHAAGVPVLGPGE
jgi:hypothetical protein